MTGKAPSPIMDTMTPNTSAMTPAEIDTVLARIWTDKAGLTTRLHRVYSRKVDFAKNPGRYYGVTVEALDAEANDLTAAIDALDAEAHPFNVEFIKRPWSRYFLVTNDNGHVHREMTCSTCFPTTQYGWLPALSGATEAEMVEEWGERACTVCFPSAPTNPLYHRPARIDREAREARQAEAAKRQADKAGKAIVDVDGSPLKDSSGYPLKTKIAARNELSSAIQSLAWYGPGHPTDFTGTARRIAAALRENAPEIDVDKVIASALKKVKDATYVAQVPALLAGEALTETIENGVDTRLQGPLEALGAEVEVKDTVLHGRTYGQTLTVRFPKPAIDAALDVLEAGEAEADPGTSALLTEFARRLYAQAK